jgi:hypothetical protein
LRIGCWDRRDEVELMCVHAEAVELREIVPVRHGRREVGWHDDMNKNDMSKKYVHLVPLKHGCKHCFKSFDIVDVSSGRMSWVKKIWVWVTWPRHNSHKSNTIQTCGQDGCRGDLRMAMT